MEKHIELGYLLDSYGELLTPRQRSLLDQYVNEDCSLAEISEREGITRQGVRDSLMRAESQLYELEKKLGLARRTRLLMEGLEELKGRLERLPLEETTKASLQKRVDALMDISEGTDGV